jgi:hypothetical protein
MKPLCRVLSVRPSRPTWWGFYFLAFVLCCLLVSTLPAQVYTGSLSGVVTDPTGGVIPGAEVTVTDTGKGFVYSVTTDEVGRYLVRPLPPSTYRLAVVMPGFQTYVQDGIVLNVNQNASYAIRLALGETTDLVEVQAGGVVLETQDAVTGQTLDRSLVNNLPILDRHQGVFALAGLAPGVTQVQGGFAVAFHSNNFISNGGRNATSDILIDGVSTSNYENATGIQVPLMTPSVDAVQEFRVQQSNFSADTGFTGSTVVSVVSRSGTNSIHGSAYWFLRDNALTANDWYGNAYGSELADRRYHDFGFTVGGPIKKDKTMYFLNVEGLKDVSARTFRAGVPSAAMRAGDFAEICPQGFDTNGLCRNPNGQLWDPYSGIYVPELGGPYRTGFIPFNNLATYQSPGSPRLDGTGLQLPARPGNLIDPVAARMMQFFPLPNVRTGQADYDRRDNWIGSGSNEVSGHQWGIKIDHFASQNASTAVKFARQSASVEGANPYENALNPTFTGPAIITSHLAAINHNQTLNTLTLLSLAFGFSRNFQDRKDVLDGFDLDPVNDLGLPSYMNRSGIRTSPGIVVSNYANPGDGVNLGSLPYAGLRQGSETWNLHPSLSRVQGKHDLKVGYEGRMHRINFVQPGAPGGAYVFHVNGTSQFPIWGGGDEMASFLVGIGLPGYGGTYDIPAWVSTQNFRHAGYLQDNWRATDRLTFNLGVRFELETPRTERYNRQSYIDPDIPSPLQVPGLPGLKGGLQFVDAENRSPYGQDRNNWGPRLGFAYKWTDKLVMRGGYGLFYAPTIRGAAGTGGGGALGFSRGTTWVVSYDGQTPWARLSNPYPISGPLAPEGAAPGAMSFVGEAINGPMRNALNATPYEQSWSFGFQRELPGDIIVDAGYVGKKGTKLYFGGSGQLNHLGPEIESYTPAQLADLASYVANPFFGILPATATLGGPTIQKAQLQRPYPQFTSVSSMPLPVANSIYHSFQLRVEKRFSHGVQFLGTYTRSKSIDDASVGVVSWMGGSAALQNPNNRSLERSFSQFDIPHVLGLSYVYDLPIGRGKAAGANWHPVIDAILGGWKTTGILRFSTGQPLALYVSGGGTRLPTYGAQRPNLTGDLAKTDAANWRDQYFANPEVVTQPAPFTLGNAPRTIGSVRSPGVNTANLSLFKGFNLGSIREDARMEVRAEAFNAFNHPQFCGPNTTLGDSRFGQVRSTCAAPREVQLALKVYW